MVAFNPDIPETQEPNYLRYSRPSNYAPVSKAAGEAIKGVAQTVGQVGRAADTLVSEGIKSTVGRQAEEDQNQYIHGTLEPEYNRLYGTKFGQDQSLVSSYSDETPPQVKALPDKVAALNAYRAKGGFVNTEYTGKLDVLAKDMRSQFPAYRDVIDREVSRASGRGEANPYARNLVSGIQTAYAKLEAAKKEDQKWVDESFKRGLIDPTYMNKFNAGEATADRAKEMLNMDFRRQHDHEMRMQKIAEVEGNDKAAHISGRRAVEGYADDTLNLAMQSSQNFLMRGGTDIAQHQRDVAEGKVPPMSEQEKLQREQQFTVMSDKMAHDIMAKTASAHNVLNEGEAEKIVADYRQRFRDWLGMSESKEYSAAPFDIANEHKARMGDYGHELQSKYPELSEYMDKRKLMSERGDKDWEKYTENNSFDPKMQGYIKAFVNASSVRAGAPNPQETPSMNEDLGILDRHGGDGNAKQRLLEIPEQIKGNNSPASKRNWVKYAFGGDNSNIFRDIEVDSRDSKGNVKQGRYSIYERYTAPDMVSSVKALGPESWNTYKDGLTTAFSHSLFGHEISTLGNAAHAGYEVSYNTENGHFTIKNQQGQGLSRDLKEGGVSFQDSIDRLNRGIDGFRNVLKGDGSDPNATVLRLFASDRVDLSNIEGIPSKMRDAILNSYGQPQPEQGRDKGKHVDEAPGSEKMAPVVSDAGDQMGMGATAMNKLPEELGPKGETMPAIRPTISGVPKSSPLNKSSNQDSRNFTKTPVEIPPELTAGGANAEYLGRGSNPTREVVPQSPAGPITALQKKLDRTLAKGEKAAKAHLDAVKEHHEDLKKLINDEIMRIQERQHALSEGGTAPADEMKRPEYK